MTRKDYEIIAAAIRATRERIDATTCSETEKWDRQLQQRGVRRAAAHIADALHEDNPRFDTARFLTACGFGPTD
jgi:hypothetical protein